VIEPPDFGSIPADLSFESSGVDYIAQRTSKIFKGRETDGEFLFEEENLITTYGYNWQQFYSETASGSVLVSSEEDGGLSWTYVLVDTRTEIREPRSRTSTHRLDKTRTITVGEQRTASLMCDGDSIGTLADYYISDYGDETFELNGETIWVETGTASQSLSHPDIYSGCYLDVDESSLLDPVSQRYLLRSLNSKETAPDALGYRNFEDTPSELRLWTPQDGSQHYQEVPLYANSDDYPDQSIKTESIRGFNSDRWVLYGSSSNPRLWANGYSIDINTWANDLQPDIWSDFAITDLRDHGFLYGTATKDGNKHAVLLLKVDVEWETLDGKTADEDPDDQLENFIVPDYYAEYSDKGLDWLEGLRYFTGGADQQATFNRTKLNLKVSIPGLEGKTVKLKAFDVDDTTPPEWDPNGEIDNSDTAGNDNAAFDIFAGKFTSTESNTATATLDENGEALVGFRASSRPGSNYRVAVVLEDFASELDALQVTDSSESGYVTADDEPVSVLTGGTVSRLLTSWRKLHIEVDSMAARPASGESGGYYSGTIMDYEEDPDLNQSTVTLDRTLPDGEDRFEHGRIEIEGLPRFEVKGNSDHWVNGERILIKGKPGSAVIGKAFVIYDDDEFNLDDIGIGKMLPYNQSVAMIEALKSKYAPAFIEIVDANDLGLNPRRSISFDLNASIWGPALDSFDDVMDLEDSSFFWAHTVIFAFEPNASYSGDPIRADSPVNLGGTPKQIVSIPPFKSHGYSVVYVEPIRDLEIADSYSDDFVFSPAFAELLRGKILALLWGTVAHEIGHSPGNQSEGGDHSELGLMKEGGAPIGTDFSAKSLKRFRAASGWRD